MEVRPEGAGNGSDQRGPDDNNNDEPTLDPDNPLYARIRAALSKQLQDQQQRISEELREKDEGLKRLRKKKEDVGVELYGVQQQLARMQIMLEKTHENFNAVRQLREQSEREVKSAAKEYEKKKAEISEQEKRMSKFQAELDKLSATLLQVEQYNEKMKAEISITRRATYKAEEQVQNLETEKKAQDLLIDDLMRNTKQLEDKMTLLSSQLEAQKSETKAARAVLDEAAKEMEKIQFEKKQLLQQWKSSLLAVARRDEDLQSLENVLNDLNQDEQSILTEIGSFKQSIRKEQARNEAVTSQLTKVRNGASFLEKQIETVRAEKAKINEQFMLLKKSLEQADGDLNKMIQEQKAVTDETEKVDTAIAGAITETQRIETQILNSLAAQTTLQKAAQSINKSTQAMQSAMHSKENEMAQVKNELARIKVDSLNTIAHNEQLKATVKEVDEELRRKEGLIVKYQLEIRRRNDEIEKKMRDLDGLNRKFETLRSRLDAAAGDAAAAVGPLEATIKNLRNEVDYKRRACGDLQRMWMSTQTELVKLANEASAQAEKVSEMESQAAVLSQKRVRMEGQVRLQEKELKEVRNGIEQMHAEMGKLNEQMSKNQGMCDTLEDQSFTMESDFVNTLKDMEEEIVRLEAQVRAAAEGKERAAAELLEVERQIMATERKIELEKELQAAYNAKDEGEDVMAGMKKEIHRMELRYAQLMRRQEELMVEMERSIFKRDMIGVRGKLQQTGGGKGSSKSDANRVVAELSKRAAELEAEVGRHERQIRELDEEGAQVGQAMEETGAGIKELQREEEEVHRQMYALDRRKKALKEDIYRLQKMAKRYQALQGGGYEAKDPAEVEEGLARADERRALLRQVAARLAAQSPKALEALQALGVVAEPAPA